MNENLIKFMDALNKQYAKIPEEHREAATIQFEIVQAKNPLTYRDEDVIQYKIQW